MTDACTWAKRNGYADGINGASVDVRLHCITENPNDPDNASLAPAGMCQPSKDENSGPDGCAQSVYCPLPGEVPSVSDRGCNSITVTIQTPANRLFSSFFHVPGSEVGYASSAGEYTEAVPIQAVITIDRTGSMGLPLCNSQRPGLLQLPIHNSGCPIVEAKNGAKTFTDFCFRTPRTPLTW